MNALSNYELEQSLKKCFEIINGTIEALDLLSTDIEEGKMSREELSGIPVLIAKGIHLKLDEEITPTLKLVK